MTHKRPVSTDSSATQELSLLLRQPRVHVIVTPDARRTEITGVKEGVVRVQIAAPAQDGKANRELERFLTALTGSRATVVVGMTSKRKTVRFDHSA